MKFRICRQSELLLLLLPALAAAVALPEADASADIVDLKAPAPRDEHYIPTATFGAQLAGQKPTTLAGIGTKDAPVDGMDGKPHAGPFVERLKPDATATYKNEDLVYSVTKKPLPLKGAPDDISYHEGHKIPQSNDGVMNDARPTPKAGTTGLEGGVSQKDQERKAHEAKTGTKLEKTPESPKEAPPVPQSEQDLVLAQKEADAKDTKDAKKFDSYEDVSKLGGLEKPYDIPEKPVDIAQPLPVSANKGHLDASTPKTTVPHIGEDEEGIIQPMHSYLLSLTMILVSEIGDKTFLIAALMAMKHDRALVFTAAFAALITMTVLSAVLGHAVPTLLPQRFTNFLAAILFLIFGAKMMREGLAMDPTEGVAAEMQEVEMELEEKEEEMRHKGRRRSSISPYALEMGLNRSQRKSRSKSRMPSPPRSPSSSRGSSPTPGSAVKNVMAGFTNLVSLLLSPAWVQTFVMTFLGEWGDRSQIATIAMAAGQDYWWVTGGAISGHAVCTGIAVLGGRAIAGRVSLRVVTLGGAIAFLVFGVVYLLDAALSG